jgi:ubiquitin carboxyl-terminal hydrolase 25/28
MDAIIEPAPDTVKPGKITLDTIPDMPSPTLSATDIGSARGASPDIPDIGAIRPADPAAVDDRFGQSVLGKRASEDRDSIGSSNDDRHRLKSESRISESELVESPFMETGPSFTAFDLRKQDSVGPVSTLADLHLKSAPASPAVVEEDTESTYFDAAAEPPTAKPVSNDDFVEYDPPPIPPPLPARPPARRASTLASGLKFGLQQDSAEVLINVLGQLELAFDPPKAEDGDTQRKNLISE